MKYCENLPTINYKQNVNFVLNACWGGIGRMKHHFPGTNKYVIPCSSVPDEVKETLVKLLKSKEKNEKENNLDWAEVTKKVAKGKNALQQMTINALYK